MNNTASLLAVRVINEGMWPQLNGLEAKCQALASALFRWYYHSP
jgi:hypothetical protein